MGDLTTDSTIRVLIGFDSIQSIKESFMRHIPLFLWLVLLFLQVCFGRNLTVKFTSISVLTLFEAAQALSRERVHGKIFL